MTPLQYATEAAKRMVYLRTIDGHQMTNLEVARLMASEWGLKSLEVTQLRREIQVEDERLQGTTTP